MTEVSGLGDSVVTFIELGNTEVRILLKYLNKEAIILRWLYALVGYLSKPKPKPKQ